MTIDFYNGNMDSIIVHQFIACEFSLDLNIKLEYKRCLI